MLILWSLDRSRIGTLWRAVGEDEIAAQSAGISLTAAKVSAFGIDLAFEALAAPKAAAPAKPLRRPMARMTRP